MLANIGHSNLLVLRKLRRKRSVVNAETGAKLVLLSVCELMNESLDQNIAVLYNKTFYLGHQYFGVVW